MSISCLKRARGSAIIVAIFLLVVLATLGAFIVSITSSQQIGGAYDVLGARAYQAAHYGSEWGVYQVLKVDTADADNTSFPYKCRRNIYDPVANPTPTSVQNLSGLAGDLSTFTVTVTCRGSVVANVPYTEGVTPVWVYQLTANACNQPDSGACPNTTAAAVGGMGYIERRVSLTVTN
jgi:MSHA biogenesis protein MshP